MLSKINVTLKPRAALGRRTGALRARRLGAERNLKTSARAAREAGVSATPRGPEITAQGFILTLQVCCTFALHFRIYPEFTGYRLVFFVAFPTVHPGNTKKNMAPRGAPTAPQTAYGIFSSRVSCLKVVPRAWRIYRVD